MSPSSLLASKIAGFSKTKVAVPEAPSRLRVSFTSGMVGSGIPLMNSKVVARQIWLGRWMRTSWGRIVGRARVNAAGAAMGPARLDESGIKMRNGIDRRNNVWLMWYYVVKCTCLS